MSIIFDEHCECGDYQATSKTNRTCKNCNANDEDIIIGPGDDDDWDLK